VPHAVNKRERHFGTPGSVCPNGFACRLWPAKKGRVDLRVFQYQPAYVGSDNIEAALVKFAGCLFGPFFAEIGVILILAVRSE